MLSPTVVLSAWAFSLDLQTIISLLGLFGIVGAAILYFFAVRAKQTTDAYKEAQEGWRSLAQQRQEANLDLEKRVSTLEHDLTELRGQNAQLIQLNVSLQASQAMHASTITHQAAELATLRDDNAALRGENIALRRAKGATP